MPGYICTVCRSHHDELPLCFIAPVPAVVARIAVEERARRVESTSDLCVIDGTSFFILGNLDIPILGREERVRWSVWSSLSETNFLRATELWSTEGRESEPPYFGWLTTEIPGYTRTVGLKLAVHTQPVGARPRLEVDAQDHLLFRDFSEGITWDRACELSHAALDP